MTSPKDLRITIAIPSLWDMATKHTIMKTTLAALVLFACLFQVHAQFQDATPPIAEQKEHWRVIHNDSVLDNYFWMYDYFGKGPDSTQVLNYLRAENNYVDSVMHLSKPFQTELFLEMKARIKEKDESVPVFKNGYFYYYRTDEGKQYYKFCRKKESMDSQEEVLLDVDKMAEGHSYYSASGFAVSPNNKYLAYGVDTLSRRQYTIYIKDLESGSILKNNIQNTTGYPCWANDNQTLFYTSKNPATLLSEKIKRHTLGADAENDVVVYHEKDNSNYIWVDKSKNNQFIFIYSQATLSSELRMINANLPNSDFKVFQPRMKDVLYEVLPLNDRFLILTNKDGAKNFKLMECPLNTTEASQWTEVIPVRKEVLLERVEEFKDFIVISERENGLVKLRIRNLENNAEHYLDFGEAAYTADIGANPEYKSEKLRYRYSSLTTPPSTYDYHINTREKDLLKQEEVLGGYNSSNYTTERIYATAKDGSKIPISLVYKNDTKLDGTSPLLLFGYGSYGASMDARFASTRLSLLNRGFIYAIAHIRGGQELGRAWYEDGKLMNKKNTFTDFIDCGEYLIQENYTARGHLYAMGGSAGGLLMGAVANMAPNLWNGLVAAVPFVDVVNTMLDESIPLTTNEFDEWGNPKNKEAYQYIKSYSPYENIEKKDYPNIFVTTGLHDSQVQYFEPAKWVAKLRAMKTDENLLLLRTQMEYGHGGASGRFDYLKEIAEVYAFLLNLEGIYQ